MNIDYYVHSGERKEIPVVFSCRQGYHTVLISKICPYFAVLGLSKYNCPYF